MSGQGPIQALSRGLDILGQFTADDSSLSLAELSRRTGLHRSTVYRFAKALETEGYLIYDTESELYGVGPAWAMALYTLGSGTVFAQILNTDLRALAESTQEGVALGVRRGDMVQIAYTLAPSRGFVPKVPDSNLHPLNATWNVHSQILLAFSGGDTRRRMLTSIRPERFTPHTLTDPEASRARLEMVFKDGVAYDREEYNLGTCAVAVPIFWREKAVAALALIVPVERFTEDALPAFIGSLRSAANDMEKRLVLPNEH
ncbi:MAG: IclR family transcriptional regulator [Actinobacteria bacterium]|nr:IclR family transcriptional regulator [Actinomycetota bacterium]